MKKSKIIKIIKNMGRQEIVKLTVKNWSQNSLKDQMI